VQAASGMLTLAQPTFIRICPTDEQTNKQKRKEAVGISSNAAGKSLDATAVTKESRWAKRLAISR